MKKRKNKAKGVTGLIWRGPSGFRGTEAKRGGTWAKKRWVTGLKRVTGLGTEGAEEHRRRNEIPVLHRLCYPSERLLHRRRNGVLPTPAIHAVLTELKAG